MNNSVKNAKVQLVFAKLKKAFFSGEVVDSSDIEDTLYKGIKSRVPNTEEVVIDLTDLDQRKSFLDDIPKNTKSKKFKKKISESDCTLGISKIYSTRKEFEDEVSIAKYNDLMKKVQEERATHDEVRLFDICEKYNIVFGIRKDIFEKDDDGGFIFKGGEKVLKVKGGSKVVACINPSFKITEFDFDEVCIVCPSVFDNWNSSSIDFLKSKNNNGEENLYSLLQLVEDKGISDLHIHQHDNSLYSIGGRKHTKLVDLNNGKPAFVKYQKAKELVLHLKMAGNIDTDTKNFSENALISVELRGGNERNFRFNIHETFYGPTKGYSVTLRRLSREDELKSLHELNFLPFGIQLLYSMLKKEGIGSAEGEKVGGMIIIGGPTNSGKSTLLSALKVYIRDIMRVRQLSVENPVETALKGIPTVDLSMYNKDMGEEVLAQFMRADPDFISVGEARTDNEFKKCMTFSMTGHLTLLTTHADSVEFGIKRFLEIEGIKKSDFNSMLKGNLNIRLALKPCSHCKDLTKEESKKCDVCGGSGADGVLPIFDLIKYTNVGLDDDITNTQKLLDEGKVVGISKSDCIEYFKSQGILSELKYIDELPENKQDDLIKKLNLDGNEEINIKSMGSSSSYLEKEDVITPEEDSKDNDTSRAVS